MNWLRSLMFMLSLGGLLASCTPNMSKNPQSEKLRKRALRNQAKLGLAFLHQAIASSGFKTREESVNAFKELIQNETNVSHLYEYGWLSDKDELQNTWLTSGGIEDSLAFQNYSLLQGLCPRCSMWNDGMILMAVGNLDDDPDLDFWTMDQTRILVHLMED